MLIFGWATVIIGELLTAAAYALEGKPWMSAAMIGYAVCCILLYMGGDK